MPWFFIRKRDPEEQFDRALVGPFEDEAAANAMRDEYVSHLPGEEFSAVFEKEEGYTLPIHLGYVAMGAERYAIFSDGSQELVQE
jgi:hypothetical protein